MQLNQITGQKIILELSQEARGRINSIYLTSIFVIGASGLLIGSASVEAGGWLLTAGIGAAMGVISLVLFLLWDAWERKRQASASKEETLRFQCRPGPISIKIPRRSVHGGVPWRPHTEQTHRDQHL